MKALEKLLSFSFSLAIYGWVAAPVHEGFHLLVSKSLGTGGRIDLAWGGYGMFQPDVALSVGSDMLMRLAGGVGAGLVFLVLWTLAAYQLKYTTWELDDASSLLLVALMQFAYAPIDAFWPAAPWWLITGSALVALGVTGVIYGKRLVRWVIE